MLGKLLTSKRSSPSESSSDEDEGGVPVRAAPSEASAVVNFRCARKRTIPTGDSSKEIFVLDTAGGAVDGEVGEPTSLFSESTTSVTPKAVKESLKKSTKGRVTDKGSVPGGDSQQSLSDSTLKLLSKSVVKPGFEKFVSEGPSSKSQRALRRLRKKAREQTSGSGWYDLPATEVTEEVERDLQIIQMRDALDSTAHYKKSDRSVLPKYFQIGTVIESKADFYSSRIPKKQRKRTIVEELMADVEFRSKQKKKYDEIRRFDAIKKKGAFRRSSYPKKKRSTLQRS